MNTRFRPECLGRVVERQTKLQLVKENVAKQRLYLD
jgi:hypothetical protein